MKTQHTPGPWKHDCVWNTILGPENQEIAAIHAAMTPQENRCNRQRAEANARLIAAAPELLELLQALLNSEDTTLGDGGCVLGDGYRQEIQSCLAKVEGK